MIGVALVSGLICLFYFLINLFMSNLYKNFNAFLKKIDQEVLLQNFYLYNFEIFSFSRYKKPHLLFRLETSLVRSLQ